MCLCVIVPVGTDYEPLTVAETVNKAKNDPAASLIFNYASNALNNSLFLDGIVSSKDHNSLARSDH